TRYQRTVISLSLCHFYFFLVFCFFYFFFFFFSSRRRHTRCLSDWSSDVCSSDLAIRSMSDAGSRWVGVCASSSTPASTARPTMRSEERRVGKECRSRWGRDH